MRLPDEVPTQARQQICGDHLSSFIHLVRWTRSRLVSEDQIARITSGWGCQLRVKETITILQTLAARDNTVGMLDSTSTALTAALAILTALWFVLNTIINSRRQKRAECKLGLQEIREHGQKTTPKREGVDIIFVHGLGSDRDRAWSFTRKGVPTTDPSHKVNWIRDLLLVDLNTSFDGDIRLYLFGYDSNFLFDAPVVDVDSLARNLLESIYSERQSEDGTKGRRIVFAAHSHGGIVVKEALATDNSAADPAGVASHTDGIIFFGTPHRGSSLTWLGQVAALVFSPWESDAQILGSIAPLSMEIRRRHERFMNTLKQRLQDKDQTPIEVRNFWEEQKTTTAYFMKRLVVDEDSATFDFARSRKIPLHRDHKRLNKFESRDADYKKVREAFIACVEVSLKRQRQVSTDRRKSYPTETVSACLRSLSFSNMDDRKNDIALAHPETCDWLFVTPQFEQWRNRNDLECHNGVLWIKGKPGAGKSTLMRHTLMHFQETFNDYIIAAYFFNARGAELEKSPLGMLRSLLYQLLDSDQLLSPIVLMYLDKTKKHEKNWRWQEGELKHCLLSLVKLPQPKPWVLLIDALDECNDAEAEEVIVFLEELSKIATLANVALNICLSSRHYPEISITKRLDLILDEGAGHGKDIITYVRSKLKITDQTLEEKLVQKADGIFMWVILVVEKLNRAHDRGQVRAMREELQKVPKDLDELFWSTLSKDTADLDKTILMLQWVLFAKVLLRPEELYFAVLAGTEPEEVGARDPRKDKEEDIKRYITYVSRGLIEVRVGDEVNVQFIHETVKDFLLRNKRLEKLDASLERHPIGLSHDRLKECCLSYILIPKLQPVISDLRDGVEMDIEYPFLRYASTRILRHSEDAQAGGISQVPLVHRLSYSNHEFRVLQILHDTFCALFQHEYGTDTNLLYAASSHGLLELVRIIILDAKTEVNAQGGYYGNALQAAAYRGHEASVQLLLDAGAEVNAQGGYYGNALQAAAAEWDENEAKVQLLLDAGAKVNAQGGHYGNALQAAAYRGHEAAVQLLLDAGAEVNAQGGRYGNALQAAAAEWDKNEAKVQLLLDAGAKVNAQGGHYSNALQAAAAAECDSNEAKVQLLLDAGAEVNAQGGYYGNALQAAAYRGHEAAVQLLLDAGAEVNAQGGPYGNALQAAAYRGHEAAVQLLLDARAKVNAQGGHYGNALQAAAAEWDENEAKVQLLLDAGAEVNAQGGHYGNALQAAAYRGHEAIVQLLLDAGAEVNAQGDHFVRSSIAYSTLELKSMLWGLDTATHLRQHKQWATVASSNYCVTLELKEDMRKRHRKKVVQMILTFYTFQTIKAFQISEERTSTTQGSDKKVNSMRSVLCRDIDEHGSPDKLQPSNIDEAVIVNREAKNSINTESASGAEYHSLHNLRMA
ncbi:MAG: hypothetical protein M1818_005836 [Claussenomyces sp. TS43310]|nr:MAG: hypothetical protein M1818_005836 [Claussenomyces sp. TS43310]